MVVAVWASAMIGWSGGWYDVLRGLGVIVNSGNHRNGLSEDNAGVDTESTEGGADLSVVPPFLATGADQSRWRMLLDFIFPPHCAHCGRPVTDANLLCGACWSEMPWIDAPLCPLSGLPYAYDPGGHGSDDGMIRPELLANPPFFDKARSVAVFDGAARHLVHQLKYYDRTDLASVMASWMARAGKVCLDKPDSWIVPVPMYRWRLWRRRYNQSALLAQQIARQTGLAYQSDCLVRVRSTRQQVGLSEAERRSNVRGAFRVNGAVRPHLAGRTIVLIDDVWTTGATLEACCRALKRAGAGEIRIITFARVVDMAHKTI